MIWWERAPYEHCRCFSCSRADGPLIALVAREPILPDASLGWHLSLSHNLRLPSYTELKAARYDLLPDGCYMAMILPPKAEFVNLHPNTLHLYEVPAGKR